MWCDCASISRACLLQDLVNRLWIDLDFFDAIPSENALQLKISFTGKFINDVSDNIILKLGNYVNKIIKQTFHLNSMDPNPCFTHLHRINTTSIQKDGAM